MTAPEPVVTVYAALRQVWAKLGPIEPSLLYAAHLADRLLCLGCEIAGVRRLPPEEAT